MNKKASVLLFVSAILVGFVPMVLVFGLYGSEVWWVIDGHPFRRAVIVLCCLGLGSILSFFTALIIRHILSSHFGIRDPLGDDTYP